MAVSVGWAVISGSAMEAWNNCSKTLGRPDGDRLHYQGSPRCPDEGAADGSR